MAVTFADIETACELIKGALVPTPCLPSRTLSDIAGAQVFLKFENLQYTGAFKERGALVKLASLDPRERAAGVAAMSAGNHAQAVAYHAHRLGIDATIVMPKGTPQVKAQNTQRLGAKVVLEGDSVEAAAARAHDIARERGMTFVHPFDDEKIIVGQGTMAVEMLTDFPDLDVIVVPIGGGGLISGVAVAAKAIKPAIEVLGVQAALYPAMYQAIKGLPTKSGGRTIAEGIAVTSVGEYTRSIVARLVDDIVLVGEEQLEYAVQLLLEIEKTVVEGAGAAALAAVLAHPERFAGHRVGLILSGGNIDMRILSSVIMRRLVRNGQLVRLRVEIDDTPGTLARVSEIIGSTGANILEVYHQRAFSNLPVKSADLDVVLETRDTGHVRDIMDRLAAVGFKSVLLGNETVTSSV